MHDDSNIQQAAAGAYESKILMEIPTEPIGSIPRPVALIEAIVSDSSQPELEQLFDAAVRDTVEKFEVTGSPVITDGEQRKYHNFWTYCVHGLPNTASDGFKIPFAAGHTRRMPFDGRSISLQDARGQRSGDRAEVCQSSRQASGDSGFH